MPESTNVPKTEISHCQKAYFCWLLFHLLLLVRPPGCGDPGTPENGRKIGTNFTVGAVVFFRCFDDFDLVGSKFRICQENATWSGTQPVCQAFNGECEERSTYSKT